MKTLSAMFHATAAARDRLDLLEDALTQIHKQQEALRTEGPGIEYAAGRLAYWQDLVNKAEKRNGKPLDHDSLGAISVWSGQLELGRHQTWALEGLDWPEYKLVETLGKLFAGPDAEKKLAHFFEDAATFAMPFSRDLRDDTRSVYRMGAPRDIPLDEEVILKDLMAKVTDLKLVNRQEKKIKTLIDDGHLMNKAKRLVWQVEQKLRRKHPA